MQSANLKIILISSSMQRRQQIARALYTVGYTQLTETDRVADLFNLHNVDYDVVVLDEAVADWQTNAELVRYLTFSRTVPVWCTFIVVADEAEREIAQLPFRYLNSKVVTKPLSKDKLYPLLSEVEKSLDYLKNLILTVESADQRQVLENLKRARAKTLPAEVKRDLNGIVIRTLFINGHSQTAFNMAAQIASPVQRYCAELLMSLLSGEREQLNTCLAQAEQIPNLVSRVVYYRCYIKLIEKDVVGARAALDHIPEQAISANDIQLLGIFELMAKGFDSAMSYIQTKPNACIGIEASHPLFQLSGFVFLVINLLSKQSSGQKMTTERFALAEFVGFNTLHNSPDQLGTFIPYLHLLSNILLGQQSVKVLEQELERLMLVAEPLNSAHWLMLAASAIGLQQNKRALDLLVRVDIALSKMEPCVEFITFEILWTSLINIVSQSSDKIKVMRYVGVQLMQRKVNYRAMRRLYSIWQDCPNDDSTNQILIELMKRLSLQEYFDLQLKKLQSDSPVDSTA